MKYFIIILLLQLAFLFCPFSYSIEIKKAEATEVKIQVAQDEKEKWLLDKERLKVLTNPKNIQCQEIWDILWSWSKKGNKEARANLSVLTYPIWPIIAKVTVPGHLGDKISSLRDAVIFGIHSMPLEGWDKLNEPELIKRYDIIYELALGHEFVGLDFVNCLKNKPRKFCAERAIVEKELVPSFETYAMEIDALIEQGMKPKCLNFDRKVHR